jgi:hypothetical protein
MSWFCYQGLAQNWNVFNKNYRYNYQHDTADIISNVLFQDSVKQSGTDTIYYLNRIASVCAGSCPGFSIAFTPTSQALITNMPQFLQRSVRKYANGMVMLEDPFKLVIQPNCVLNQTWLFDSLVNYQATCTSIALQTLFGVNDSVKTIVVNNTDTVQLSKSFGIIKFPVLYGKNKNYRLKGIEKRHSYDSVALYGIKVPNAWDFYNYQVGDIFCESYLGIFVASPGSECRKVHYNIVSKVIAPTCYVYTANIYSALNYTLESYKQVNCDYIPFVYSTTVFGTPNLSSENLLENKMYPGMMVVGQTIPATESRYYANNSGVRGYPNMAFLKKNTSGRMFKSLGYGCANVPSGNYGSLACGSYPFTICPYYQIAPGSSSGNKHTSFIVGEGMGILSSYVNFFELSVGYCRTCFMRNGVNLLGSLYVDINETNQVNSDYAVFPNPTNGNSIIKVPASCFGKANHIKLKNVLGETLLNEDFIYEEEHLLNTQSFSPGIYFIGIYVEGRIIEEKKLIIEK